MQLEIFSKKTRPRLGASISVNGVCLTVSKKIPSGFSVDVTRETLRRTHLGSLRMNCPLNLESALRLNGRFDGHIVSGHIDAVGKVLKNAGGELYIAFPKKLAAAIAEKGSIAVNGVSLTVSQTQNNSFSVALIPFTEKNTNLGYLRKGDFVNLEIDIIARYLKNFYENRRRCIGIQ